MRVPGTAIEALVVEDDPDGRFLLADYLSTAGYLVRTATDGASALRELDRNTPDVLVLDLILPWVNGLEVLATVREQKRFARMPVLVTTGTFTTDFDLRAFRPIKVMRKPLAWEALASTIEGLLVEANRFP